MDATVVGVLSQDAGKDTVGVLSQDAGKDTIPGIVKFAFIDFEKNESNSKYSAKCKTCKKRICGSVGVTSCFTRLV